MENVVSDNETGNMVRNIRLRNPLNIGDLLGGNGASFELDLNDLNQHDNYEEPLTYDSSEVYKHLNLDCLDFNSTAANYEGTPFAILKRKMCKVTEDDKIMKQILREGVGDLLEDMAYVTIHYNAYVEDNDEPFDSTYLRKSPHRFHLNTGDVLPGLNISVGTMKRTEKAQFLVHPDYAYGPIGCFERVPKNANILYEIEVLQSTDALPATDKTTKDSADLTFSEVLNLVKKLIANANAIIERSGNYRAAIREYNEAASRLEMAKLADYDEQIQQNQNLLRLYTNLAISYNRIQNPQKVCINCDKIYRLVKGTSLLVPAKVYYNHAKALMNLNSFKWAERKLRKASNIAQSNPDIIRLYLKLNKMMEEYDEREKAFAKAMIGNSSVDATEEVSAELKTIVQTVCEELKNDEDKMMYNLPDQLSNGELQYIKETAKKFELTVIRTVVDKDASVKYKLSKVVKDNI